MPEFNNSNTQSCTGLLNRWSLTVAFPEGWCLELRLDEGVNVRVPETEEGSEPHAGYLGFAPPNVITNELRRDRQALCNLLDSEERAHLEKVW